MIIIILRQIKDFGERMLRYCPVQYRERTLQIILQDTSYSQESRKLSTVPYHTCLYRYLVNARLATCVIETKTDNQRSDPPVMIMIRQKFSLLVSILPTRLSLTISLSEKLCLTNNNFYLRNLFEVTKSDHFFLI